MIFSAILLILYNTNENISYFYTPSELAKSKIKFDKRIRIGGFVEENTFLKITSNSYKFNITDEINSIEVIYRGILPDLFKEGQGAVIEGSFEKNNLFKATSVFAKHDENYMPPNLETN